MRIRVHGCHFSPADPPTYALQFTTSCFYNAYTELRCTLAARESNSLLPRAVAPGAFLCSCFQRTHRGSPMAEHPPTFEFEDIPLEEARLMGRGPRMEHTLYGTLTKKIQALAG